MNKILAYALVAILLGSVTMVVPLVLLGPDNLVSTESTNTFGGSSEDTSERDDELSNSEAATQQADSLGIYGNSSDSQSSESSLEADFASEMSSVGLMIVPSFLIALGVFVYLKKRMA